MNRYIFIIILAIILVSCKKEEPDTSVPESSENGLFICNEGNYTFGNSSLSYYDIDQKKVSNYVFYTSNNFPLGDIAQSIYINDNKCFIVVNNSGKIVIIDPDDYSYIGKITGLVSPRYMLFIDNSKAYVSDLYSKDITIINPSTYNVVSTIHIGSSTEQMIKYSHYIYATSWSENNKVFKINTYSDLVEDSITVTKQPNSIVMDKNNKLWVLSDGAYAGSSFGQDTASLTMIDAETFTIERIIRFNNMESSPSCLITNSQKDSLFFINGSWSGSINAGGVYKMSIEDITIPASAFIPENGRIIYKITLHPAAHEIYVSDVCDYVHDGTIFRYYTSGNAIDTFKVNIIPGSFCFKINN